MATTVGSGSYQYELNESWARLPAGWAWGQVSAVATDSQDRVYAFQRKDPPVVVFDREGNYLSSWGHSAIRDPHGIAIVDDVVYLTDRDDHVALKFTLDGKPLMVGMGADFPEFHVGPIYFDEPIFYDTPQPRGDVNAIGGIFLEGTGFVYPPLSVGTHTLEIVTRTPAFLLEIRNTWHIRVSPK